MKLVLISDTHGNYGKVVVPDGDVLIHCGDITASGTLGEYVAFNEWLKPLPHKHKIVIGGNHDFALQRQPKEALAALDAATYLEDEEVVIDGLHIYGSPWQPEYLDLAFNLPRGGEELFEKWEAIPAHTNILVTHGPPHGVLDRLAYHGNIGCELLRKRLKWLTGLKLHCFGHIHEGYGMNSWLSTKTTFINAALTIGSGPFLREPIVFEL